MGSAPSTAGVGGAEAAADELMPATKALGALAKKSGVSAEELLAMDAANLEATAEKAEITADQISERATAIGIDAAQLEAASKADSPKGAALALILERVKSEDAALKPAAEPAAELAAEPTAEPTAEPGAGAGAGARATRALSFKPDPAVLKAAQEKRKAAHAKATAARVAAEAEEDSEDEGPCPGDAPISSNSEDEEPAAQKKTQQQNKKKQQRQQNKKTKQQQNKKTKKKKQQQTVGEDEHAEDDFEVNLHLWADKIGKTWEWRKKKQLNSEWRTIELRDDQVHTCVIQEGVKRDVKETVEGETGQFFWHVASNNEFWGDKRGSVALFSKPPNEDGFAKPVMFFSRKQFEEQYLAEVNKSLH